MFHVKQKGRREAFLMTDFERMRERKDAAILRQYDDWMDRFGEFLSKGALVLLVLLRVAQLSKFGW